MGKHFYQLTSEGDNIQNLQSTTKIKSQENKTANRQSG